MRTELEKVKKNIRRHRHICPVCEHPFRGTHNQRYCGKICRAVVCKARRGTGAYAVPVYCGYCNESFTPERSYHKFCSEECLLLSQNKVYESPDDRNDEMRFG